MHLVETEEGAKSRHEKKCPGKQFQGKKTHLVETEEGIEPRHAAGRLGHGLDVLPQILKKSL